MPTLPALPVAGRAAAWASHRHQRPQVAELSGADPRHLLEILDGAKATVCLPPVHDALGEHRADPGKGIELLDRRAVEVNRAAATPRTARRLRRSARHADEQQLSVADPRGEV